MIDAVTSVPPALLEALTTELGADGVLTGDSERDLHATDLTFHLPHRPDLVVYPTTTAQVSRVLALASEHRIPVTPFGAGTSLEGHVIPTRGGISLDLSRLTGIVDISPGNLRATVSAGVTRLALERRRGRARPLLPRRSGRGRDTRRHGRHERSRDDNGSLRQDAGERPRPGGRARRRPNRPDRVRAAKTSAGYDLTGLLVGSEGTLAVITEVTVRLQPIPEEAVALRISFPDVEAACATAAAAVGAGAGVTRLELLDAWVVSAVNAYSGTSFPEAPCLFVEATGTRETVEGDLELVQEIARSQGAIEIVFERDPDARSRLWKARHSAAHAAAHKVPGSKERVTDVCVPLTELAEAVHFARSELERLELEGGILGHAGDGNLHISLHLDPNDPTAAERSDELVNRVVDDALARGGTCTGEHGIGIGKIGALEQEHGDLIPLMAGIKAVFDPLGIMNPGKVLPTQTWSFSGGRAR